MSFVLGGLDAKAGRLKRRRATLLTAPNGALKPPKAIPMQKKI